MFKKKEAVGFVLNPFSGTGSKKSVPAEINSHLNTNRYKAVIEYSSSPGNATDITKNFLDKGISKVIAVGGDGTVNEVAKALIDTNTTLGIIPLGSGNGLARHLKIPLNIKGAVHLINHGRIFMMDHGVINNTPFFCTAGVGFDAYIGHEFSKMNGRGFLNYIRTTIKGYKNYKPQHYSLGLNGNTIQREAFLIALANASQYGNNAYIAPGADIADGLLDVTILSPFPKFLAPSMGIKLFNRKIDKSNYVETFRVKELNIIRETEGAVHYDGEPTIMGNCLNVSIKHLGIHVFVP